MYCRNVRFRRPARKSVSSSKVFGAVSGTILETPWKMCLDFPPNIRTSPESKMTLSAFSASLSSPYKNSADSPMEKDTIGIPLSRLSRLSSLS